MRELDISDSCYNYGQQHVTKVYFHSNLGLQGNYNDGNLGFYTMLDDKFLQMFSEEQAASFFSVAEFDLDVQASKMLKQTYQPTLPKKPKHFHSSNTYHRNLKTCMEV
jgi:hypothetical protein